MLCDARQRDSVKKVLIALIRHAIDMNSTSPAYQGRPLRS